MKNLQEKSVALPREARYFKLKLTILQVRKSGIRNVRFPSGFLLLLKKLFTSHCLHGLGNVSSKKRHKWQWIITSLLLPLLNMDDMITVHDRIASLVGRHTNIQSGHSTVISRWLGSKRVEYVFFCSGRRCT